MSSSSILQYSISPPVSRSRLDKTNQNIRDTSAYCEQTDDPTEWIRQRRQRLVPVVQGRCQFALGWEGDFDDVIGYSHGATRAQREQSIL